MGLRLDMGSWENHGDFIAADFVELLLADFHEVLSVVDDFPALLDGIGRENAHDGAVGDRFSRAALADDGQRFALVQVKADVSHRLHLTRVRAEGNLQIVYGKFYFLFFHGVLLSDTPKNPARAPCPAAAVIPRPSATD